MRLKGKGGAEDKIAQACQLVYEDEFGHMLAGISGIAQEGLTDTDWTLMERLVVEQLHQRIRMRNEQFSFPISEQRVQAIYRGDIEPTRFDYEKAGLAH
jgi:hypothetical protein